ncbi:hypothetical protein [Methylobacterium platani]|uniref:Uncharacterized protein n=2 Tax=Methylobacterium platani TaxID=427683 RepID=A0A179S4Z3_9HYPH|nr:hypothetical protein [Methylobacterium platani]KMO16385.1 hypothetical protein SQ03_14740 [Methylobacterium platani JCM 14648]OAS19379.1 hypothetical protein A5481_25135 [Methylobacterium platani]
MPATLPALLAPASNAPLFLHLAGSLVFVAAAGRGIGWALDAWVRRAPPAPEERPAPPPQSGARSR